MQPIEINQGNYAQQVAQGPILLDFWAEWCGPCQMIAPIIEQIAGEHPQLRVGKVNVDDNQQLAMSLGVNSIPTLIYYEQGRESARLVRYHEKAEILRHFGLDG